MSLTTEFIAELIKATNEADRLSPFDIKRLLNRSSATICDMLEIGIQGSNRRKDVLTDLPVAAERANRPSAAETRDAFLDAAAIIRTLKIVHDGKD
jgi:hypothetical protein